MTLPPPPPERKKKRRLPRFMGQVVMIVTLSTFIGMTFAVAGWSSAGEGDTAVQIGTWEEAPTGATGTPQDNVVVEPAPEVGPDPIVDDVTDPAPDPVPPTPTTGTEPTPEPDVTPSPAEGPGEQHYEVTVVVTASSQQDAERIVRDAGFEIKGGTP